MIVTIDGPAGAGKSSVAQTLARRLGFRFLDTGAMYRAVAYAAIARDWPLDNPAKLAEQAERLQIEVREGEVRVDGQDVTGQLRSADVTSQIHRVADNPRIRQFLVRLQQQHAEHGDLVTEGRDQGTVAFPEADCKIFLTASAAERAQRRAKELQEKGQDVDFQQVLREQEERDRRDAERDVGRLIQADDAVVVVTDGLSFDEVVDHLESLVRSAHQRARRQT
jgi:CMP/dCMP kinase